MENGKMAHQRHVSVIGLGYVGLPVAVAFGMDQSVVGFDVNPKRIKQLTEGEDITGEVDTATLNKSKIKFTCDKADLKRADFHIVAVPTPVDNAHKPDLTYLQKASELLGSQLKQGDIVVYESTVYPGATEEDCVPILEEFSKLKAGRDFFVGYSPERINPGDKTHTFTQIKKVVSGADEKTTDIIADVYGAVVTAGVFRAKSIKVAEAAKVIENTQRDLNISLMNELAKIFELMDIDSHDVIEAASTKWNFIPFKPGLVGGHCIGVDPYYLTYKAELLGYRPEVILAGRRTNDNMGKFIAEQTVKQMIKQGSHINGAKVAVLGLTFKEDCPDLRNSRVIDVINELKEYGLNVLVHDPLADKEESQKEYGIELSEWKDITDVDAMVLCVSHKSYLELKPSDYAEKFASCRFISDVKSILDVKQYNDSGIHIWRL
jgi:UDP-N-acetyl-D-galactosamine dehydrogenase